MGLVVKRPGALSKIQMLNLVLGVGVFSLLPKMSENVATRRKFKLLRSCFLPSPFGVCCSNAESVQDKVHTTPDIKRLEKVATLIALPRSQTSTMLSSHQRG